MFRSTRPSTVVMPRVIAQHKWLRSSHRLSRPDRDSEILFHFGTWVKRLGGCSGTFQLICRQYFFGILTVPNFVAGTTLPIGSVSDESEVSEVIDVIDPSVKRV
eukprot:GHVN01036023.1.p3 GENE.GHVN01036023.1~~GHVN01036023.1.p3  ORF type:complete len:104 (+),score=19.10 GHVN01036023.1:510-821(+)